MEHAEEPIVNQAARSLDIHHLTLNVGSTPHAIDWCVVDGELIFNIDGKAQQTFEDVRSTLHMQEEDELNLLKHCLAQWAPRGYEPKNGTKSAAIHIVKTDAGQGKTRAFIGANFNHVDEYQRFDAEALTMGKVKEALGGKEDFVIDTTYLMIKHATSKLTTPCGTCRDELVHFSDEKSKVVCVPFLTPQEAQQTDLNLAITRNYADKQAHKGQRPPYQTCASIDDVPKNHGYKMHMSEMLPLLEVPVSSPQWQGKISTAFEQISDMQANNQKQFIALAHEAVMRGGPLQELGEGKSLADINHYLVKLVNHAYAKHNGNVERIRAVVVVSEDGKCYSGISVMDSHLPEKPPADVAALMAGLNERNIKEVFVMELEPQRIQTKPEDFKPAVEPYKRLDTAENHVGSLHTFKGRTLDRLNKNSYHKDPIKMLSPDRTDIRGEVIGGRSMLHVIPYNDGKATEAELKEGMVSKPMAEYYAHAYHNPKSEMGMSAGCC